MNDGNGRSLEDHLDSLVRHIELVREAGLLCGKRLIRDGEKDFGRLLIARVFVHDASKFYGIEWDYLHNGNGGDSAKMELAVKQHRLTNEHHPEFWGHINLMPRIAIAEMVCDWLARAQEFGSCLRDWIEETAISRFSIDKESQQYKWIMEFVDIILEDQFVTLQGDKV